MNLNSKNLVGRFVQQFRLAQKLHKDKRLV